MTNYLVKVLKRFYEQGIYDDEKLKLFLKHNEITEDEFNEIVGGE